MGRPHLQEGLAAGRVGKLLEEQRRLAAHRRILVAETSRHPARDGLARVAIRPHHSVERRTIRRRGERQHQRGDDRDHRERDAARLAQEAEGQTVSPLVPGQRYRGPRGVQRPHVDDRMTDGGRLVGEPAFIEREGASVVDVLLGEARDLHGLSRVEQFQRIGAAGSEPWNTSRPSRVHAMGSVSSGPASTACSAPGSDPEGTRALRPGRPRPAYGPYSVRPNAALMNTPICSRVTGAVGQ